MDSPTFDQRIADWLEDDPSDAPAQLLVTVRAALPSIPQRRGWSRFGGSLLRPGLRVAQVAAMLAAVLLLAGLAWSLVGPPSPPSPSPTAAASPVPLVRFDSPLYGFAISYPAGWRLTPATERIAGINPPFLDTGVADQFSGTRGEPNPNAAMVASMSEVAVGTTLDTWTSQTALAECGTPTQPQETIEVAGQPATVSTFARCNSYFHIWVTLVRGTQAFHIVWLNFSGTEVSDRQLFDRVLDTFRLPGQFASAMYGYSLELPEGAVARAATARYTTGIEPAPGDPGIDQVSQGPGQAHQTLIYADALRADGTLDTWVAASAVSQCRTPDATDDVTVDGEAARLLTFNLCYGESILWVVVVHGDRGYAIIDYTSPALKAAQHDELLALLETFRFEPA